MDFNVFEKLKGNEKIIVCQGKGGVGKSTYASQVVAAYLYYYNGGKKVKYIEVDDANKSANLYENSEILEGEKISVKNDLDLSLAMQSNENIVIDIGGNKTTEIVIKKIGENEDLENVFWVVPLDTGKDSAQNAFKTVSQIDEIYEYSDLKPKIMFILNGSSNVEEKELNDLKLEFSYFFGSNWMDLDFTLLDNIPESYKNSYLFFNRFEKIMMSTALKKLAIEISTTEFIKNAKEEKTDKNAEFIAIQEKVKNGEATDEDLEKIEKERVRAFDVFRSVRNIESFTKTSIYPHFKELHKFMIS